MIIWPPKDATEVEDFEFDFTGVLASGEKIASKTVTPDGVAVDRSDIVDIVTGDQAGVQVWLSAGSAGTVAKVTCTIVTDSVPARTFTEIAVLEIGGEVLSLDELKAHLRVDTSDEDTLINAYRRAALAAIERQTSKKLTQKIVSQVADGFPKCDKALRLFQGPVSQILSIKYDDSNGVEQTLTSFRLVEGASALLLPAYLDHWPSDAMTAPGSVRLSYIAGYDPTELPSELIQAVMFLAGHFYANRESVIADNRAAAVELPMAVDMLIAPYTTPGIG